jgi:hypothetical protein
MNTSVAHPGEETHQIRCRNCETRYSGKGAGWGFEAELLEREEEVRLEEIDSPLHRGGDGPART